MFRVSGEKQPLLLWETLREISKLGHVWHSIRQIWEIQSTPVCHLHFLYTHGEGETSERWWVKLSQHKAAPRAQRLCSTCLTFSMPWDANITLLRRNSQLQCLVLNLLAQVSNAERMQVLPWDFCREEHKLYMVMKINTRSAGCFHTSVHVWEPRSFNSVARDKEQAAQ